MGMIKIKLFIVTAAIFFLACSSWKTVSVNEIAPKNLVEITLASGQTVQGEILATESQQIVIKIKEKTYKVDRNNIASVRTKPAIYDEQGEIITEDDISRIKTHKQMTLFTIGGGALSFGASFFIGSMVQRSLLDDDTNSAPRIAITAIGTVLGSTFFAITGNKRDRNTAIEIIRDLRASKTENTIVDEKTRREEINKELNQLIKDRKAQEAEIEALKKKIEANKKKKKIPPPGNN